jgi:NhaP-type Na+/H+ and K+/H+ antiporter
MSGQRSGAQDSLTEMALRLAKAIDGWQVGTTNSAAAFSAMTKAHQELRATLAALMEVASDADDGFAARMSTPVRDAAKS